MPVELTASDVSSLVSDGHNRVKQYRAAARDALREFVGNYYVKPQGMTGESPINLLFVALRTWVPNLAARSGVNRVITDVLAQSDYAHILGLGLDHLHRKIKMRDTMRAGIVNMIIAGLAIFKTSIEASGNLLTDGDDKLVDPGQIYTELVSLDDFFFDPFCTSLNKADFLGHYITVRRQKLLDQEGWDRDLVMRLPTADTEPSSENTAKMMTQTNMDRGKMVKTQDYVRIAEVYVPEAESVVYVPDPSQASFDGFLKMMEYYGPAGGGYRFGSLTPPVTDNPFPVAPVSMWRDLNAMANNIFLKLMGQADNQKDVLLYRPGMEDVADAIADAADGEKIRTSDPQGVEIKSFGGSNPDNDKMIQQLQTWFNYMAGNPDQAAGIRVPQGANTATAQNILQSNASITQEDAKSLIYDLQGEISSDQGWYMFHDELINIPSVIRTTGDREVQVFLTREQRVSEYEHLTFKIVKRSMQEMDPAVRRKNLADLAINIVPGAANAAMILQQMGYDFKLTRYLSQVADELGVSDVMTGVIPDTTFEERMTLMQELAPQQTSKQLAGTVQNNGNAMARPVMDAQQQKNQEAQGTAAESQASYAGAF